MSVSRSVGERKRMSVSSSVRVRECQYHALWGRERESRALFQGERGMPVYCSVSSEKANASLMLYSGKKENLHHSLALCSLLLGLGEGKNFSFLFCLGGKENVSLSRALFWR